MAERNAVGSPGAVTIIDLRRDPYVSSEDEGGRWATYCEHHGEFVQHETRQLAREWATVPSDWCEQCRTERDGGES